VRWRFALLNLVMAGLAPLQLLRVAEGHDAHLGLSALANAGIALWAIVLYRTAGRPSWLDPIGPLVVLGLGVAGDPTRSYAAMFMLLFLHSLYGGRGRALRNALLHLVAYQISVLATAGWSEIRSEQLVSDTVAVLVMSFVLSELAASLRRSDRGRRRETTLLGASRDLLRATELDEVAAAAVEGTVRLAAEDDIEAERVTVWWQDRSELILAASHGVPLGVEHVDLTAMPADTVARYLQADPVRLDLSQMHDAQRAAGVELEELHALAVPLTDGDGIFGVIFIQTRDRPLSDDVIASLQRFADEVVLAQRAARRHQLLTGVLTNSADGIVLVDRDSSLTFVSPAVAELSGRDIAVGAPLGALLSTDQGAKPIQHLADIEAAADALGVVRPDGTFIEVEVSMRAVAGEGTVLNVRDVSGQRRLQDEIAYRAHHDFLTGLPNRGRFLDRLEQALATAHDGRRAAVALLDLDDFKSINDAFGHLTGDEVLRHVAATVQGHVRSTDVFARLGGDEFALLLDDLGPSCQPERILDGILAELRRPFAVDGHRLTLSASCGLVVSTDGYDAETMIGDADLAMYAAKDAGKDALVVFDTSLRTASDEARQLRTDLEAGIERDELRLHYQPLMTLAGEKAIGAEALVRWAHPTRGLLPPDRFIPIAEETGQILPLGRWVLRTACEDLATWVARGLVDDDFQLHVNLSADQLAQAGLVSDVEVILAAAGVEPRQLVFEITETALACEPDLAERTLRQLHRLGFGIAIDDFGTGYASFSYLRRFPTDIVKIDRSFVADVTKGPEDSALAHAIVRLASNLGMLTVAEGVEQEPTRQLLETWGCQRAQGWLWAPALPARELVRWLEELARTSAAVR
jgi:diguanylate cyclase (GGDEF)-like protein